jgi:hypothetical protein
MQHAHHERPSAQPQEMHMIVGILSGAMEVQVTVEVTSVSMRVFMEPPAPQGFQEHVTAQQHEHAGDTPLECALHSGRDGEPEGDDSAGSGQQRCRVPGAPEGAQHARAHHTPVLAHERRDGGDVVGVERMPEPEDEADAEGRAE